MKNRQKLILAWAASNGWYLLFHPTLTGMLDRLPDLIGSFGVNLSLLILPGLGWASSMGRRRRTFSTAAVKTVVFSCVSLVFAIGAMSLAGATSRGVFWTLLWVLSNLGFLTAAAVESRKVSGRYTSPDSPLALPAVAIFIGSYALLFWMALRVVPAQADHDFEVEATGYGLVDRFEPLLLTDRGSLYYFAHPPLLHFVSAGSFLLYDQLGALQYYDELSIQARRRREGLESEPPAGDVRLPDSPETYRAIAVVGTEYVVEPVAGGPAQRISGDVADDASMEAHFRAQPHLLATRTPNVLFSSLTVALLFIFAAKKSRYLSVAAIAVVAYLLTPEVLVRSSYGGYFAIGGFLILCLLLSLPRRPEWRAGGAQFLAAAGAAVADHKLVLFVAAIGIHDFFLSLKSRSVPAITRAVASPAVIGFLAGTVLFWGYGLWVSADGFITDHLYTHLLDRISHDNPLGYQGYPGIRGLWREFLAHTGYLLIPASGLTMLSSAWGQLRGRADGYRPLATLLLLSIGLIAIAFTLIDWRMTKHLSPIILLLVLGAVPARGASRPVLIAAICVLAVTAIHGLWVLPQLAQNFDNFAITPAW